MRPPDDSASAVLRVILERVAAGSRPGDRDDGHVVCLAVEGGGMRGAVSAGMCVVLEAAGAVSAFDRIYGVSAGALNGWATAAGQAALGATHYQDAVSQRVIDRTRALRGRPVIDFALLFDELIGTRKPLSFERLSSGPEFRALATSLETMSLRVLQGFGDAEEVRQAVRASASLPRLGGKPPVFRGERMTDGALIEPIPFETPLAEGATHVLVLRSCSATCRKPALAALGERLALHEDPRLFELARERQGKYNRQAAALQDGTLDVAGAHVDQVAVPHGTRLIGRLEADSGRVIGALRLGAAAMASTLLTDAVSLCWQPVVYRAAPVVLPLAAAPAAAAPVTRWRPRARRASGWSAAS
jgi:predicted acylesterase/phospholipase RssA